MVSVCDYEMYVWSYCDDVLAAIAVPTHAAISLANFLFNFSCLRLYVCMYVLYDMNDRIIIKRGTVDVASAMYVKYFDEKRSGKQIMKG